MKRKWEIDRLRQSAQRLVGSRATNQLVRRQIVHGWPSLAAGDIGDAGDVCIGCVYTGLPGLGNRAWWASVPYGLLWRLARLNLMLPSVLVQSGSGHSPIGK
jgi:hypothetical protein